MPLLTELQMRCLRIVQRTVTVHQTARTKSVAWELGKTDKQATDCLNRLLRKGFVTHEGIGLWGLTAQGLAFIIELPPGE